MRISRRSFAAAVLLVTATVPSALEAQFAPSPPTGASNLSQTVTVDPNNPASATITTIDRLYGIFKIVDHYYYDCLKKKWVWVSRDWSKKSTAPFSSEEFTPAAPPKPEYASPSAKELPSGRPPGSETSPGDPDRAFNPTTGQNFAKQPDGSWIDVKTGKVAVAPKLCPCPEPATAPTPPKPARTTPPAQPKLDKTSSRILDIQNGERLAVGAPPLRWNETLAAN